MAEAKKRKRTVSWEARIKKRESDRARHQTRINIGAAFSPWREIMAKEGCKSDAELAMLLIESFVHGRVASTPGKGHAELPPPSLSSVTESDCERREEFAIQGLQPLTEVPENVSISLGNNCHEPPLLETRLPASQDIMPESVMDSSDCTGAESQSSLNRREDVKERTKRKPKDLISTMQKSVLTNMKEEEDGESLSLTIMREDESYEEGYRKEEEKQTNEKMGGNATCPDAHTDELVQNTVNSEQGQQEENDLFSLVRLLKQPKVLIAPLETSSSSVPVSSPPRSMVTPLRGNGLLRLKKDQVLTPKSKTVGQLERPMELLPFSSEISVDIDGPGQRDSGEEGDSSDEEYIPHIRLRSTLNSSSSVPVSSPPRSMVTPLRGNGLLRLKKDQVLTQKNETAGQLERPMELLPFSSEIRMCAEVSLSSPVVSSQEQNTGQTVEETSQVFASSQCPFVHTEEVNLYQDIEKVHTEQLSRTLGSQKLPSSSRQHPTPPKTLPTPTQSHTGLPGAYTCSHCGKSFAQSITLKTHVRTHTGERPYLCSQCGRGFTQSVSLTRHLRTHTGERPFSCSQCGKTFANTSNLQLHQRTHLGVRLHLCSQCGKSYATALNLKIHQRTHTGERPYTCSLCGKSFAQWNCFKMHQRTHTGERPYPCSHCGKSFAQRYTLKVHQRIHTGERPYSCSHCGQSFSQLNSLNVHLRNHTGKRP